MCRSTLKVMLMAMILVVLSASLFAQQTGTITGTVLDKTGAVIPGAKVTLTNTATKDIRHSITNGEGFFSFNAVVSGSYAIKTEFKGFRTLEQGGISLSPGDRRNLNIEMAIGKETEQITVESAASEVQVVDSGDRASVLTAKDIKNLALQGRDITELVKTLPGFNDFTNQGGLQNKSGYSAQITSIGSSMGNGFSGNGSPNRAGGTDLMSDGAHVLDPGCNCNSTQTINADMVQEVKVSTSSFGADSVTGPVLVQAVGKSGSSEYHGSAYLHFRDSSMNSVDYNLKQNKQEKPSDRYWYPGGSFGGPVPFTKKKLLFWTGYEYYNQSFPDGMTNGLIKAMVPTVSERAGKLDPTLPDNAAVCAAIGGWVSGQYRCQPITAINTSTGFVTGIQNSDISSYISPGAKALLKMIPLPNHTPTAGANYNFVTPVLDTDNGYMFHTRVDYNINDSTKLYVSFNQQHDLASLPVMRWWIASNSVLDPGDASYNSISRTLSGNFVKVLSPTMTNEFTASLGFLNSPISYGNTSAVSKSALGYPYKSPTLSPIMPSLVNSWWTNDFGIPMIFDGDMNNYFSRKMEPSFADNLTKVLGTHTLKAGASWFRAGNKQANTNQGNGQNGQVAYGPIWDSTGSAAAGCISDTSKQPAGYTTPAGYYKDCNLSSAFNPIADFLTDRVSGFSYTPDTINDMGYTTLGFYLQDDWKASKKLTLTLGLRLSHDPAWTDASGKYGVAAWTKAWYDADVAKGITNLPGMRWNAKDKSIPLTGRSVQSLFYAPRFGLAYDLFGTGKTVLRGGFGAYYYHDQWNDVNGALATSMGGTSCSTSGSAFLSQVDAGTSGLQCAGSGGGVTSGFAVNPNDHSQPLTYTYNFTISQQTIGNSLLEIAYSGNQSSKLQNPLQNVNLIPVGAFFKADPRTGVINPIDSIKDSVVQDYRPLSHYTSLNIDGHGAWANYNALQVSLNKQRGALTYNLNYTWSKTMGINGQYNKQADLFNLNNNYGVLNQDRSHVFSASYSYEVGNRFRGNKVLSGALNGWMISGITSVQSGAPMQQSFTQNFGLNGTDAKGVKLDATHFLGTTDGVLMPKLACNPTEGLTAGGYVNPGCFALPNVGSNGQIIWPYIHGPAFVNSDLSVARTIKVTEHQNAQIKFSAFNFLNHPLTSFDQNNSNNLTLNYTNGVLAKSGSGWNYGVPNEKFGRRVLELSIKYNF